MLRFVCPCGHSAELPEQSVTNRCSKCARSLVFESFEGPKAYDLWAAAARRRAFAAASLPRAERGSVEFFVTSQNQASE